MKRSLASAGAVVCLGIAAVTLHAASNSVVLEDAGLAGWVLDRIDSDKIATPAGRPVLRSEHQQARPQDHEHGEETLYVLCESGDYGRRECYLGTDKPIEYVEVHQQLSRAACTRGATWGFDGHSLWVSNGCRARFVVRTFNGRLVEKRISCASSDYNRQTCWTGLRAIRDVYANQVSRAACTRGSTWGVDGGSVWVSNGCRAVFTVYGYERW